MDPGRGLSNHLSLRVSDPVSRIPDPVSSFSPDEPGTEEPGLFFLGADAQFFDLSAKGVPVDAQEAGCLELNLLGLF